MAKIHELHLIQPTSFQSRDRCMSVGGKSQPERAASGPFRIARTAALLAILVSVATDIEARGGRGGGGGFRGGGIRGGGVSSFDRGSDFGRGSYDRGSSSYRSGSTFSREGNYSRPSALDSRPSRLDGGGSRLEGNRQGTNWGSMTKVSPGGGSATQLPATRPGDGGAAS